MSAAVEAVAGSRFRLGRMSFRKPIICRETLIPILPRPPLQGRDPTLP